MLACFPPFCARPAPFPSPAGRTMPPSPPSFCRPGAARSFPLPLAQRTPPASDRPDQRPRAFPARANIAGPDDTAAACFPDRVFPAPSFPPAHASKGGRSLLYRPNARHRVRFTHKQRVFGVMQLAPHGQRQMFKTLPVSPYLTLCLLQQAVQIGFCLGGKDGGLHLHLLAGACQRRGQTPFPPPAA